MTAFVQQKLMKHDRTIYDLSMLRRCVFRQRRFLKVFKLR